MLDYFSKQILFKISELCPDGNFQIIESGSFKDCFDGEVVEEGLDRAVNKLKILGLVSLRYDRDGEYCLTVTDKGRSLVLTEKLENLRNKKGSFINCFLHELLNFFVSFCAALLALFVFYLLKNA